MKKCSSRRPRRRLHAGNRPDDGASPSASPAHRAGYDVSGLFSAFLCVRLLRQALDFQHQVFQLLRDTRIVQAEIEML